MRKKIIKTKSTFCHLDTLIVIISIFEEHIQTRKHMIVKDSDKEKNFVNKPIKTFRSINIDNISDINSLKSVI